MTKAEWVESWKRIKQRFPEWNPTPVEAEDFCLGLRVYPSILVEKVGGWVAKTYSSKTPKLAWYVRKCEEVKKLKATKPIDTYAQDREKEHSDYEKNKEESLQRLLDTDVTELRKAYVVVKNKWGHLITPPDDGDIANWKPTFRSLVYLELYGGGE